MSAPGRDPVPFTVIGGYLGAGKTTLLNRLLVEAGDGATRERIAVVVNDVGRVPIDTDLIAAHDGATVTLTNGCICCSLADDFALALPDLLAIDPPIDRVVVEASGLSDPGAVAQYGTLPGFRRDGVLVLADAETVRERATDPRIGHQVRHQLHRADLVVITKADLVGPDEIETVRTWVHEASAGAPTVVAHHGHVPRSVLFDTDLAGHRHPRDADRRHHDASHDAPGSIDHGVDVVEVSFDHAVERSELDAVLDSLPVEVLRVKGVVDLRSDPGPSGSAPQRAVVQIVGRRRRVTTRPVTCPARDAPDPGRLILVAPAGILDPWDPPAGISRTQAER